MFTDRAPRAGLPRPRLPLSLGLPALLLAALPATLAAPARTSATSRAAAAAKARAAAMVKAPGPEAIMPVSQLKPGMKGYGLTVFKGTKIERFDVDILGVLPAANFGKPLVLIRMSGGPITSRGAFLIQGMSGSPVYVNNKLVGAFAYGNAFPKEPIGMVTPIQDMMEALDERLPAQPAGMASADLELPPAVAAAVGQSASAGPIQRLFVRPDAESVPLGSGLGMAPLTTPVMVSGMSARSLGALQGVLRPFNMAAQTGAGRMAKLAEPAPSITPGAGIGVSLMTGDMDLTAVGTVTWRKDNRILAFGHPFMQIGASNFPVSTVWVHDVFSSFQVAFKIASPVKTIGTLMHDRPFSVYAKAGPAPEMVPVTCRINDEITKQKRTFKVQVANHPLLLGQLTAIAVGEAVMEAHPVPGDVTAEVRTSLDTEQFGKVQRDNTVFDPVQIDAAATQELAQMMSLLSMNSLRRVPVKSLDVDVTLVRRRPTATIERIFLKQERFEPGETAEVGVVIRPYRAEPVTTRATITIPDSAASGRAVLMVSGGTTRVDGLLLGASSGSSMGMGGPPSASASGAANVAQLLRKFLERERNNQLATRIIYPSMAVSVDGIKLSQLPAPLVDVMRSSRATGVRVERDETKVVEDTEYVLSGVQALSITIQRKDVSEKGSDVPGISLPGAGLPGGIGIPAGASIPGRAELSEESIRSLLSAPLSPAELATPLFRLTPEDEKKPAPPAAPPAAAPAAPAGSMAAPPADPAKKPEDGKKPEDAKKPEEVKIDNAVLGRQPVTWKQTSLTDFQRGTFTGTAVTASGDVVLSPGLKPLFEANEQYVWSVVSSGPAVYAGTGNSGLVYRVAEDGKATVFCSTGELQVHALAKDGAGNLYAGTSPCGKVVRISPDGKTKDLVCLNEGLDEKQTVSGPQFLAKYVLSLAVAPDGTVYAGTGPDGKVYRISPEGKAEVLFAAKDKSILSLLLGSRGEVYAGTSDGAFVYRIEPDGKAKVILDSDQQAITGIARDDAGNLYAATAPKGTVHRIRSDGAVLTHFDRAKGAIHALSVGKDGAVYAACGNVIYRIESPDNVTAIADSKRAQFMSIAWDEKGRLVAGSANVGSVYRADPVTEGTFESTVHDAKTVSRWGRLRSVALLSPGGQLAYETRSGNTPQPDATWSEWTAPRQDATGSYVSSPPARYLQYRVTLRSEQGYGVLKEMAFFYMPRNEAPTLTVSAPAGGEIWRGPQPIKWAGADPNKDTLTYEIYFSPDMGRTWLPVGEKLVTSAPATPAQPGAEKPAAAPMMTEKALLESQLSRHREELALAPNLTDEARRELIAQAETLVAAYTEQNPGAAAPKPPAKPEEKPAEKKPGVPAKPGITREQTLSWDTAQVPDGVYLVKVVATDRASNPSEPLSIEKVSEPVIVVNQPPTVLMLMPAIQVNAEKQASITGLCHSRVALKGAQFRVDEGEWVAIDTLDGIWDSGLEQWRLNTDKLAPGEHTLQVKTVDAAGNIGMTQAKLTVP